MTSDSSGHLTSDGVLEAALRIARAAGFAFMATTALAPAEGISMRLMQPFPPDDDFTVWLGTGSGSRKVAELTANPMATLAYQSPDGPAYAVARCSCTIVTDPQQRRGRWRDDWRPFFPGGPEGDDYLLLRLRARRLEVVDFARGIAPPPYGVKAAAVVRERAAWRLDPYSAGRNVSARCE